MLRGERGLSVKALDCSPHGSEFELYKNHLSSVAPLFFVSLSMALISTCSRLRRVNSLVPCTCVLYTQYTQKVTGYSRKSRDRPGLLTVRTSKHSHPLQVSRCCAFNPKNGKPSKWAQVSKLS